MPTKIIVKDENGDEVGMSTDDFAEHRHHFGKEPFDYKGENCRVMLTIHLEILELEGIKIF
jgi:hypothetical protein